MNGVSYHTITLGVVLQMVFLFVPSGASAPALTDGNALIVSLEDGIDPLTGEIENGRVFIEDERCAPDGIRVTGIADVTYGAGGPAGR